MNATTRRSNTSAVGWIARLVARRTGYAFVKVLSVRIEGDCLAAAVATEADIAIMRAAGLEVVDTHNNLDELAVVFYPTMLLVQR